MSKPKQITLIALLALLALAAAAAPLTIRPALLYWAKYRAHQIYAKLDPEIMRNMNAVPMVVTLPAPGPGSLATEESNGYLIRVPQPQSKSSTNNLRTFVYPQFTVLLLQPFSTAANDAKFQAIFHMDYFDYQVEMNRARPDDIDAQPDLPSLKSLLLLLSGKSGAAALATYFAEFKEPDRRGFIMAVDANRHRIHAEIQFPKGATGCGMYFQHPVGVPPAAVMQFLANLQIEPAPAATSTASRPADATSAAPAHAPPLGTPISRSAARRGASLNP